MLQEKNQKVIIRFSFFMIVWIIIVMFIYHLNSDNSGRNLISLFAAFIMLPTYITNIIQNINNLNLFDSNYFWSFHLGSNISWIILFWLFAGLYFSLILTLLSGNNERIKNKIWIFHFCFFTYALILKAVQIYFSNPQDPNYKIVLGSDNIMPFLGHFIVIATNIFILTRIKKEVDLEFLKDTIEKYVFLFSEYLLTLLIALTMYNFLLSPSATMIDRISVPLGIFLYGFFIFLCIKLIQINYKMVFKYLNQFYNRKR